MQYPDVTDGSRVTTGLKISVERAGPTLVNNSVRYSLIFPSSIRIQTRRDACGRDEGCEISRNIDINKTNKWPRLVRRIIANKFPYLLRKNMATCKISTHSFVQQKIRRISGNIEELMSTKRSFYQKVLLFTATG